MLHEVQAKDALLELLGETPEERSLVEKLSGSDDEEDEDDEDLPEF